MPNQVETKRAFVEVIFWFFALTIVRFVLLSLVTIFHPASAVHVPLPRMVLMLFSGNFATAIVITLLNRLLQYFLKRIN